MNELDTQGREMEINKPRWRTTQNGCHVCRTHEKLGRELDFNYLNMDEILWQPELGGSSLKIKCCHWDGYNITRDKG